MSLEYRLHAARARLRAAALACDRDPASVRLLAVSKGMSADTVREAAGLGQRAFGESYAQEAREKQALLADLDLEWHFIGPLQGNKTRFVAEHFAWVHGLASAAHAVRLAAARAKTLPALNLCLQVNVSGEASKGGVEFAALPALYDAVRGLPGLRVRGLMGIAAPGPDLAARHAQFGALRAALETLNARGANLDTLSMGMSDDLEAAVAEGATLVRLGTAVFGARSRKPSPAAALAD